MDKTISVKDLIEAGVHLGHKRTHWNPKMAPYIFAERKGICVIDPEKTLELLKKAGEVVKETVAAGGKILFVGTRKSISDIVEEEALRCGAFYCTHRWLGGTLTNFTTVRSSVEKLKLLEEQKEKGDFNKLTKKERLTLDRKLEKMNISLSGIKEMDEFPGIIYITAVRREKIAVAEAVKLKIPIVAIVDTNVDPEPVSYPIPGNDDAIKSIGLITKAITDSVLEGMEEFKKSGKN